jgi:uncharacterized membrane protein
MIMKLSAPKIYTFWIAVVLVLLGFIGYVFKISALDAWNFLLVLAGFVVLAVGNLIKGF